MEPRPNVAQRILAFNRGREPERLALKYRAMRENPFAFLRGTCHLFYEDWPRGTALDDAPLAWITGDLHLENFGCFRGDNRLVYFDLNDFDEAVLAPATWEIARLLTSARLVARLNGLDARSTNDLLRRFVASYRAALRDGKARWVERATARGMVRDLLHFAKRRTQGDLLDVRTRWVGGRRRLKIDGRRALPVSRRERARLMPQLRALIRKEGYRGSHRLVDVCRRVAGTGSLGVRRYVMLVRGGGGPSDFELLDLKEARPSALAPYLSTTQPAWKSPAHRIVSIQHWVQAANPALLRAVKLGRMPFVVRELQPAEDRLALNRADLPIRRLRRVVETMGRVVAWGELRSGGREGSATADDWVSFARRSDWIQPVLRYSLEYSKRVIGDWDMFRKSRRMLSTG